MNIQIGAFIKIGIISFLIFIEIVCFGFILSIKSKEPINSK